MQLTQQDKQIIVNVSHIVIIIPLVFLAIRRDLIPSFVNPTVVMYIAYAILLVGLGTQLYSLVMNVKDKMNMASVANSSSSATTTPVAQATPVASTTVTATSTSSTVVPSAQPKMFQPIIS